MIHPALRKIASIAICSLLAVPTVGFAAETMYGLPAVSNVSALGVGNSTNCAVADGGVQCWGVSDGGRLFVSDSDDGASPVPVQVIRVGSGATAVSIYGYEACAVVNTGVICWGGNRAEPQWILDPGSGATSVSVGNDVACSVVKGGLKCWGENYNGTLGVGDTSDHGDVPIQTIPEGYGVTDVSAGFVHVCAVANGGVLCWGGDEFSTGHLEAYGPSPIAVVPGNSGAVSVAVTHTRSCAIVAGGAKCWSWNSDFEQAIPANSGATKIGVNGSNACAVVSGGVSCWGRYLGDDPLEYIENPVAIIPPGSQVKDVDGGGYGLTTCALIQTSVQCWGIENEFGQLGLGRAALVLPKAGLWWNPTRSGHGFDIERSGPNLAVVWYTYGEDGLPTWYLASGPFIGTEWRADLSKYQMSMGSGQVSSTVVGSISLNFFGDSAATLRWQIGAESGAEPIVHFAFSTDSASPDLTGLWYDPSRPGYGLTLVTQGSTEVSVMYFYDANGSPRWTLGASDYSNGAASAPMSSFIGPCQYCAVGSQTSQAVGSLNTRHKSSTTATIDSQIGLTGSLSGTWNISGVEFVRLSDPQ